MGHICVRSELLLGLLEEVSRTRALASHETDMLQDLIAAPEACFEWTEQHCADLLEAAARGDGVARFARRNGISPRAAYQKLFRMRRQQRKGRKLSLQMKSA